MDFFIPSIISFFSLIAMIYILVKRAPELKWIKIQPTNVEKIDGNVKKRFSPEFFLQKILSKTRVATLKAESKISGWLASLRKKSADQKNKFSDDYWKTIKGNK